MSVLTWHEVQRDSRLGKARIAGVSLLTLLVKHPGWWEPGFTELRSPACRILARIENAARRREAEALQAGPVLVGTIVDEPRPKAINRAPARRRARALPAAR